MSIQIVRYEEKHEKAVRDFNIRLKNKGEGFHQFPESYIPKWLPGVSGLNICQKFFLAVEDDGTVRGAYILKCQDFFVYGKKITAGCIQLPMSEGIVDKNYSMLGARLIFDALEREPNLYALGIGSYEAAFTQVLLKLRWKHYPVPFYFRVVNPSMFFKHLTYLRNKKGYSFLLDLARFLYLLGLMIKFYQFIRQKHFDSGNIKYEEVGEFGKWADTIWEQNFHHYSLIAERTAAVLNHLYPPENLRFIKLKVTVNDNVVGWAVLLRTQLKNHRQFGEMTTGSIVESFSVKDFENHIIYSAVQYLLQKKVHIIVTNVSDTDWCKALAGNGFINGPSNYILLMAKSLSKQLEPFEENKERTFFNRGDGDGPITL